MRPRCGPRDRHIVAGAGHEFYVKGIQYREPDVTRWSRAPRNSRIRDRQGAGYMGTYTGAARIDRISDLTRRQIIDSSRENHGRDLLFAEESQTSARPWLPRVAAGGRRGQIIAVVDGVSLIGSNQVVAINRGTGHGIETGPVLAIDAQGEVVADGSCNRPLVLLRQQDPDPAQLKTGGHAAGSRLREHELRLDRGPTVPVRLPIGCGHLMALFCNKRHRKGPRDSGPFAFRLSPMHDAKALELAWLSLLRAPAGLAVLRSALSECPDVVALARASPATLRALGFPDAAAAFLARAPVDETLADHQWLRRAGARLLPFTHPDYPAQLAAIPDAPLRCSCWAPGPAAQAATGRHRQPASHGRRPAHRNFHDPQLSAGIRHHQRARPRIDASAHLAALDCTGVYHRVLRHGLTSASAANQALFERIR